MLAKKPTKFMTNSRSIGGELKKRCDGGHADQPLVDGKGEGCSPIPASLVPG